MITPAILDAMLAAGCTADQIVAAVKASLSESVTKRDTDADEERKRAQARERQRRRRERLSVTQERDSVTVTQTPPTPSPLSPLKETPKPLENNPPISPTLTPGEGADLLGDVLPRRKPAAAKPATPRHVLEAVLDVKQADAVIDHRQRLRKPLTLRAAELLANEFAKCPDPNAAADMMVAKGWQGFEAQWMENRNADSGRGRSGSGNNSGGDSRSEKRMRAWLGDGQSERDAGGGITIDGEAANRPGD